MDELLKQFPSAASYIKTLLPYVERYGYLAIFAAIYIEDFGVPFPGETILIICSIFAAIGKLDFILVGVIGFAGAVLGDNTGFAIGHYGGRRLVLKFGKYFFLTEKRLDKFEDFFERHGSKIIIIARFIEGLRQFNGIIAGTSRMRWKKFIVYNSIGAALWVGLWVGTATILSNNLKLLFNIVKHSEYIFPIIFLIPFIISRITKFIKKIKSDKSFNS
jgi:membrane protein DedA with SNARE-associated domain